MLAAKSKSMNNWEATFTPNPADKIETNIRTTLSQKPLSHYIRIAPTQNITKDITENTEKQK